MAYANYNPSYGPGEVTGDRAESWLTYHDDCCPAERRFPWELKRAWMETREAIRLDSAARGERGGEGFDIPSIDTPTDLVDASERAAEVYLAHNRFPWWPNPMIGEVDCATCGEPIR